jgi:predicted hotdog family 3-hydroxylacyl-ACP dehydratase
MSAFPPLEELIPHAGPMLLLDQLCDWSEGSARCTLTVRERAPFVSMAGEVESAVTIEYMAQAVAACLGYEALRGGGSVRVGMIIASKRFVAHGDKLRVGDALVIDVKRVRGNELLSHFDCWVRSSDALFSEATLTLYHAEKPPDGMG